MWIRTYGLRMVNTDALEEIVVIRYKSEITTGERYAIRGISPSGKEFELTTTTSTELAGTVLRRIADSLKKKESFVDLSA